MSKKYRRGYTQGVFDMFHIGHLNLFNNAKAYCDYLIVGVNSDDLVKAYKNRTPVICESERAEIVRNIKAVDEVVIANTLDKEVALEQCHFDVIFIGDDWKGNARWEQTGKDLARHGVDLVYLPYTKSTSSTILRPEHDRRVDDEPLSGRD